MSGAIVATRIFLRLTTIQQAISRKPQEQEAVLKKLGPLADRLKADSSQWHNLKKAGVASLKSSRADFEEICKQLASRGLFVNPSGELEASLSELGIKWESNKREWMTKALTLIPNLAVEPPKQPWKLVSEIHDYLQQPVR